MRTRTAVAIALLLLAPAARGEEPYTVIVHPGNPATQIQRGALAVIFKGEMVRWKDNLAIVPVDQSVRASVRNAFSDRVLGQPVAAIQTYWQRQMMQGRVPPMVKPSDEDVVAFVRGNRGAIGYVSGGVALDGSVKALKLVD